MKKTGEPTGQNIVIETTKVRILFPLTDKLKKKKWYIIRGKTFDCFIT